MHYYTIKDGLLHKPIRLGTQGENKARIIVFDFDDWKKRYGRGVLRLTAKRNGDDVAYPVPLAVRKGKGVWTVTDTDNAKAGLGVCEFKYLVNGAVVKSAIFTTIVDEALDNYDDAPDVYDDIIEKIDEKIGEAHDILEDAESLIPAGGTAGQVLKKASDEDFDTEWADETGGGSGEDGATFIPSVSDDGIISWTNDKEKPNPEPKNILGPQGATGTTFTPIVSSAGVISWTNDGDRDNPTPVDIVAAVIDALPVAEGEDY